MPYSRRTYRRRTTRRAPYRKRVTRRLAARRSYRMVRRAVTRMAEKKEVYYAYTGQEVSWSGRVHHLTGLAQGLTNATRVGNQIQVNSLTMNLAFKNTGGITGQTGCVCLVQDTQQVGDDPPDVHDIFSPSTQNTINMPLALLNEKNVGRFKILYRRIFTLADQTGSSEKITKVIRLHKKLNINVRYNGPGTGDPETTNYDIERNGLYLVMLSDGAEADDDVYVNGPIRLRFTDI